MKKLFLISTLALLATPAFAQEEVDRNAQMELLKQNFMARQGIQKEGTPLVDTKEEQRTKQENEEYRAAALKAINERKIQLQGVR